MNSTSLILLYLEKRLDQTNDMLEMLDTDTPAERLVKAWTYLTAAGEFLKRVIFVVVGDIFMIH